MKRKIFFAFSLVLLISISFASAYSFGEFVDDLNGFLESISGRQTGNVILDEKSVMVNENSRASLSCDSGSIKSVEALYWCPDGSGRNALCSTEGAIGKNSYYFDFSNYNCGGDPCVYVAKKGTLTISCGDVVCSDYRSERECYVDSSCMWVQGPTYAMVCQEKTLAPVAKIAGGGIYLRGRVIYEDGTPAVGAVLIVKEFLPMRIGTIADEDGSFVIDITTSYDGRNYYTVQLDYFGKEELIYPEESKDIIVDAIEVDEVISEASVPHAVVEAHYENNLWGCNTYGNSDFSTCKNEVIKIHNGDEVRFDGSGSSFEGFPILESDMSWYRIYNEDDVSELRRLIESEANSLILRNFFDNIQLKNGGININLNEGVDVLIGRKSINIKFKFSSPFGFDSNTKETQYVALEVKDIFGDYSGYYIQEVSVGCFDNSRSCDANDVVAGISRGDVAETVLSSAEITELTFKTCNTDADCNRWMCSLGSCVPRNYEDLACKLSSGRGESVSYNGKTYNNPFYGNPLFKQIASASPATASECVAGDVSKVKIPICTENGVSFETKPCPSGTSCSEGVCVESECIDDYSSKTKDDCWNAKGLCVDGSGCVDFEDMGWPDEVLINVLELKTSSEVNVRRNAIYAIYALRKIGSEYAVPVLIKVLETDSDANVKRETIYALGKIGSEDAVPVLARVLETDTDSFVRKKVVNALGEIGSESVIPILENTLRNDPDQYVRIGAAESLEKIYLKYSTSDSAKGEIKQAFIRTLEIRTLEDYHDGTAEKTLVMILKKIGSEEILQILERLGYLQGGEISSFRISEKAKSIYNGGSPSTRYYELKANYKMMTGANPIGIIGDLANYPDFVNGLVTASEATGLSPEFIASSIEQEGLARLLKTTSFLNDYPVNTFSDIGMDTFVDDLPLIQSKYGLLNHIDYESLKDKSRVGNEVGLQVVVADINLKDAVLGIAGMLALRRDRLVQDMQEYNVNLNEFEQEWYIYLYYNLGASYGKEGGTKGGQWYLRNRRSQEVYIQSNRDLDKEFGETGNSNFHFNAGRVAGGSSLIKDLGIFEEDLLASF